MFETPKNRPKRVNKKVLLLPKKHLRKWRFCGNDEATGRCYPEILTEQQVVTTLWLVYVSD